MDGNNRTALVAAAVCLCLNGNHLADTDDVESFFLSVAREEPSVDHIEACVNNQSYQLTKHNLR